MAVSGLLGCRLRCIDELRDPLVAALEGRAVHRLELGWREGMRRGAPQQHVAPCLETRELLEMPERLHAAGEMRTLQGRRISRVEPPGGLAIERRAPSLRAN